MADIPQPDRFGVWRDASGRFAVEYSRKTMEAIRAEASMKMHGIGRGGVEVGGVVLGTHLDRFYRILEWRPIACSHSLGPSFVLSSAERESLGLLLSELDAEAKSHRQQVLGWFVSHTRSDFELTQTELELNAEHFPDAWNVVLVLQLSKFGDAEALVYCKQPDVAGDDLVPLAPPIAFAPLPVQAPKPKPADRPKELAPAPPDLDQEIKPGRRISRLLPVLLVLALTLAAVTAVLVGTFPGLLDTFRSETPINVPPFEAASLHATIRANAVRITWDAAALQSRQVSRGTLDIVDAGRHVLKDLSDPELRLGRFDYPMQSSNVSVTMTLYSRDRLRGRESTRLKQ